MGGEEHIVEPHRGCFALEIFKGVEVCTVFSDKNNAGDAFVWIRRLRGNDRGKVTGAGVFHLPEEAAAAEEHVDVFCFNGPHKVIHAVVAGLKSDAGHVGCNPERHLRKQSILVGRSEFPQVSVFLRRTKPKPKKGLRRRQRQRVSAYEKKAGSFWNCRKHTPAAGEKKIERRSLTLLLGYG